MPWLKKTADLVEVVTINPGASKSGTCEMCETLDGEPTSEVGRPPFHNHCKCKPIMVQMSTQPEDILEEDFAMEPAETVDAPREPGGVTELEEEEI